MQRRRIVMLTVLVAPPLVLAAAGLTIPPTDGHHRGQLAHPARPPAAGLPSAGTGPVVGAARGEPDHGPGRRCPGLRLRGVLHGAGRARRDRGRRVAAVGAENGVAVLFTQADDLVRYGVWAYLAATVLVAVVLLRRTGVAAVPGAVLIVGGAWSFLDSHIFWPRGC